MGLSFTDAAGLSFTVAAGPRQRSHSLVRGPRDSRPYIAVSDSRLPQPGGSGPHIYIPQEQDGPDITPGTGFPFRHLLRLAGLRWRYSTTPSHGILTSKVNCLVVKVKVMLRPTVSRAVCLGIKHPSGTYDQIFLTVWRLQACWCEALSLTRGRVCHLPVTVSSSKSVVSMYNLHFTCY
jgi:hypothetical protein